MTHDDRMTHDEHETRLRATKARQGEASGRIRYVLTVSVISAAVALLAAWWFYFG
jgi:hypothetical protein